MQAILAPVQPYIPSTQIQPATATPSASGTGAVGTSLKYAREDHVHPLSASSPITYTNGSISHSTSGVSSGTKGDTQAQTPGWGGTFNVTHGTVNTTGHLTTFEAHTVKIPEAEATQSAKGLMSISDKTKLDAYPTIKKFSGTVSNSGSNPSISFSDAFIKSTSLIEIYTSTWGIMPTSVTTTISAGVGTLTITFSSLSDNLGINVIVQNFS